MVTMTILNSHEEWLKNRMNGIGGSEISAVIGCNPYMSNVDLWEIKTRQIVPEDISDKPYVKYGAQAEAHLRELFKLDCPQYTVNYIENNSFKNDKYPWAQASLDGWMRDENGRLGVWECKTTNILRSMQKEKWNHRIPDNYYCQCLFYMAVMEADFCILKAQLKFESQGDLYIQTKNYPIERSDVADDIEYLMDAGEKFWQMVKERKRPAKHLPSILKK